VLLNPEDRFTVEIAALSRGKAPPDTPRIDGRIAGVREIVFRSSVPEPTTLWSSAILKFAVIVFLVANFSLLRSLDIGSILINAFIAAWKKFKQRA
jgi:hypothetical protein